MLNLAEYRSKPRLLADFLPWAALVGAGVVLNKDGSLQRSARFRGPDLDSATPAELVAASSRLNGALRRLGSGWTLFTEARRIPAKDYPESVFPDPVSAMVEAERKAQFEKEQAHFESRYVLTIVWLPPAEDAARAEGWLYEGRDRASGSKAAEQLSGFVDRSDRLLDLLQGVFPEVVWLSDAETLTYLHGCVSPVAQNVRVPETPMHLDALLADTPFTGGLEPRLGAHHIRTLSIIGFPSATFPGILDDLNRLAFPYRWSTRAIFLDKTDAAQLLTRIRRQWFAKRKGIGAILKEIMTNEASTLLDSDAANKAVDADEALQELGADIAGWTYVTATLTVMNLDPQVADEQLRVAEKVIQGRDFTIIREGVNAVEAWLGSLPGHLYANVRQPPISTLNLAHMIPLSAIWAGPARNDHLDGPPLFHAQTAGATPFRFSTHVGDVGHGLIVGPTGAGKSVLLALMALQFHRYAGAQVFAFDFGGSIRAAALAMGGDWHDLGGALSGDDGQPISLQPLARIHEDAERVWAAAWIAGLLGREGVEIGPATRDHIWSALTNLASAPVGERTLTGLAVILQSSDLKQALQPYTLDGPWGRLLDAENEALGGADVQAFETEGLIGTAAAPSVLAYLFHRIEGRLTGNPTLILIDEGWLALDDPTFGAQLKEWMKTLRKKNASVIFATQSLADIDGSAIAPAIVESCPTRIFLPNERALEPQIAAIYDRFGLNARQIDILAQATPKRDYYCQSRRGNRLFELGLSDVALAFCAASLKTDQTAIAELIADHGQSGFAAAWLRHRGLDWAAELLPAGPDDPDAESEEIALAERALPTGDPADAGARATHPDTDQTKENRHDPRTLRSALFAGALLAIPVTTVVAPLPAEAGLFGGGFGGIVYDPTNHAENLLTAARSLEQINNQIASLQNEAAMLVNQARNLAKLPHSSLAQLQQSVQRTQDLLGEAQRIAYDVASIEDAFATDYAAGFTTLSDPELVAGARGRWQTSIAGFEDALKTQASVVGNLDQARTTMSDLVTRSQNATGALQAAQAGNQLVALQSQQLADLTALMAAQGRAQSLEQARQAASQEQAREQLRRFIAPGAGYTPSTVDMFGGS